MHGSNIPVRDCFAGSFAGDVGLLKPKHPIVLYNIIDIHNAVVHYNKKYFLDSCSSWPYDDDVQYQRWKEHIVKKQERDDVEREFKDAIATNDKETKELISSG